MMNRWIPIATLLILFSTGLFFAPPPVAAQQANVHPNVGYTDTRFAFYATGFDDNEPVGVWLNTPDGQPIDADINLLYRANDDGRADWYWIAPYDAQPGTWEMVARGLESGVEHVIPFTVTPRAGDAAGVNVVPESGYAGTRFAFFALDFEDSENVAVWANDPTGKPIEVDVDELFRANDDGRVDWYWDAPDNAEPGIWQMVVYGKESEVERVVSFEILPR